ncbi:PIG-L family deacetylase [Paracoccus pantotrophus]|uniref:PIG-L family deacetylase n=2 Tax=Paracoccus TaxID=265 RepID=A0A7H9BXF4_PARPN|nr:MULTISPECIES: PIG-L deacetylase family protein [Paracoccus]QLH16104.1 PIG-L family deacetylase [Paracoccus pantotrophus]UFM65954.1 PIG-L family deacetylase [Paracoccus sp. MA]
MDIADGGAVVILAPHADDETLGCGQLIAALSEAGVTVQVIVVTDGAASHRNSRIWPPARLAALRAGEVRRAVAVLGNGKAPEPCLLGYPDLAAPDDPPGRAEAVDRIDALMPPKTTALLATWQGDPHPDHQRVARIAALLSRRRPAMRHWAYPVWGRFEAGVPPQPMVSLHDPALLPRKAAALAAHRSQMSPLIADDPAGFTMPATLQQHFIDHPELFIDVG